MLFAPDERNVTPTEQLSLAPPSPEPTFLARLAGSPLQTCFEFWRGCRVDGKSPLKRSIDPTRMPIAILPHLFIYELVNERFRCRLAGTENAYVFARDPTGRFLDEMLLPAVVQARTGLFRGVVGRDLPLIYGGRLADEGGRWGSFERLLLPVTRSGAEIDIVFGMAVLPRSDPGKTAKTQLVDTPHDFETWATRGEL